jgi:hypothetical protein
MNLVCIVIPGALKAQSGIHPDIADKGAMQS